MPGGGSALSCGASRGVVEEPGLGGLDLRGLPDPLPGCGCVVLGPDLFVGLGGHLVSPRFHDWSKAQLEARVKRCFTDHAKKYSEVRSAPELLAGHW